MDNDWSPQDSWNVFTKPLVLYRTLNASMFPVHVHTDARNMPYCIGDRPAFAVWVRASVLSY